MYVLPRCFHCPHNLILSIPHTPHILLLTLIVSFSPWPSDKLLLIFQDRKWHLLCKSFPGSPMQSPKCSALLYAILYLYLAERGIRAWKTWTDISIHQLIARFIPWLSFSRLNQRDPESISYFSQRKRKYLAWGQSLNTPDKRILPWIPSATNSQMRICRMFLASWEHNGKSLQWGNDVNTEIETQYCLKSCFPRNLDSEQMFAM